MIRVVVSGAKGRMGSETVKAISAESDMEVAGEVDAGDSLAATLEQHKPDAVVDFSVPSSVLTNVLTCLKHGVVPIVGTTGLSPADLKSVRDGCALNNTGALVAPNFAIGAVLMMRFARDAARYMPEAEIIEMHHEQKLDAPSGTAIKTAELIAQGRERSQRVLFPSDTVMKFDGARGGLVAEVPVHSVRLPGFVASQMVIFGGQGQTLTIRHDSIDRKSFMPGVVFAVRQAAALKCNGGALVYGLENLMEF